MRYTIEILTIINMLFLELLLHVYLTFTIPETKCCMYVFDSLVVNICVYSFAVKQAESNKDATSEHKVDTKSEPDTSKTPENKQQDAISRGDVESTKEET